jgi:large subunit ribosomal protein L4
MYFRSADKVPQNLVDATSAIPSFNIFPIYGLNCYSMMKYETLVLSLRALDVLEGKILGHLHQAGPTNKEYRYMDLKQKILAEGEHEEDPVYTPFC